MAAILLALALATAPPTLMYAPVLTALDEPPAREEMFAQTWVNGIDTGLIVAFLRQGDDLAASGDDLRAIGIEAAAGAAPVPLAGIAGLASRIDEAGQSVRLTVPAAAMRRADIAAPAVLAEEVRASWGGLLNYSLYADEAGNGGATGEFRLFGPAGNFSNGVLVRRAGAGFGRRGGLAFRRLETRYMFEDPQSTRRLTVGDFISSDGSAEGAIRGAGIQLATDFTLQPDLVTAPMPDLAGGDGVPSTVDLYVDGVRRLSQDVGAGRFAVSGVPMVDGAGRISLLVRDALGHESVRQVSFYGSRQLLRPGLTASSVQAGFLRRDAFQQGDRYGTPFAAGTIRRGLNSRLTGEARLAAAGPVQVVGAGLTAKLGEFAIASLSGDLSHSADGTGARAGVSIRRDDRHLSLFAVADKSFGRFDTLADRFLTVRGWRLQGGASWQSRWFGSLALSGTLLRAESLRSRILAATWSRPVGERLSAFVNIVETRAGDAQLLATAGLTLVLSARSTASVQAGHDRTGATGVASWSRASEADGGLALRAGASLAPGQSRLLGGATWRGDAGEIGGDIQYDRRGPAVRGFASGAAVWLGGAPRLAARIGESFAVVETGQPDIAVMLENRPAGRTRADGSLLLPNLPANAPVRIALDYDGIDLDYEAPRTDMVVRPRGGGGAVVHMPIRLVRAITVHIVSPDGGFVPLGSIVRRADGREDVVGYDGTAYLTDVADDMSAEVSNENGRCRIHLSASSDDPIVCRP